MTNLEAKDLIGKYKIAQERQSKASVLAQSFHSKTTDLGEIDLLTINGKESSVANWKKAYQVYMSSGAGQGLNGNMQGISRTLGQGHQVSLHNLDASIDKIMSNAIVSESIGQAISAFNTFSDKVDVVFKDVPELKKEVVAGEVVVAKKALLDSVLPASFSPSTKKMVAGLVLVVFAIGAFLIVRKLMK